MSRDNVEVVRLILAEWERGEFGTWSDRLDPEIAFETFMPDASENVTAHGVAELVAFTRDWLAQWRRYRIAADEIRAAGPDKVFASVRQFAAGQHSGAEVESPGFTVWTLEGGRVVKLSVHYEREKALEAAGLRE